MLVPGEIEKILAQIFLGGNKLHYRESESRKLTRITDSSHLS